MYKNWLEVFLVSTKLGITSFGGPIAHLGYFYEEYVRRRKWMDERSYSELVAICQILPGPTSSQVGIGIGIARSGWFGGIAAGIGFAWPSIVIMILFALFLKGYDVGDTAWIHGLKIAAVAIVAQAIVGMGQKLTPDRSRITIAVFSAIIILLWPSEYSQLTVICIAALIGLRFFAMDTGLSNRFERQEIFIHRGFAICCIVLFPIILLGLPLLRILSDHGWLAAFDSFYRTGSLVFGGGHVVLPLLEREVVSPGWISQTDFLSGYGAAQALPGPLFTFAAFLGMMKDGIAGAIVASTAIFLPSYLLLIGTLHFWQSIRANRLIQGAITSINAAVVGILLSAFYQPLWTSAILSAKDFSLAALLFAMLAFWKLPSWTIVLAGVIVGKLLGFF